MNAELLSPERDPSYQDYFAEYFPVAFERVKELLTGGCYVPRWYQAPSNRQEAMTEGQYLRYALSLQPGSYVWAFWHRQISSFVFQVTDVELSYKWFSQPMPDHFVRRTSNRNAYCLPVPHPVVAPGILLTEFWFNSATPGNAEILFGVLEPLAVTQ